MVSERMEVEGGDPALAMLAARIRQLRLSRKLSLRQLGELSGTSASFISQLERQRTGMRVLVDRDAVAGQS